MQKLFLKPVIILFLLSLIIPVGEVFAQIQRNKVVLTWVAEKNKTIKGEPFANFLELKNGFLNADLLPLFASNYAINGTKDVSVKIENAIWTKIQTNDLQHASIIKNGDPLPEVHISYTKKLPFATVQLLPFRLNNGQLERLEKFDLVLTTNGTVTSNVFYKQGFASNSVLASGDWYRIYVNNTGIHKITKSFLRNLGINVDGIDPRTIKVYGNGPGILPGANNAFRNDDLFENPIQVNGESDGKFDEGDAILFYGKSQQDVWNYDTNKKRYIHQTNIYADATAYFITFGGNPGKRITTTTAAVPNQTNDGHFDFLVCHEKELVNLLKSGTRWFGEEFNRELNQTFSVYLENADFNDTLFFRSSAVGRAFTISSFDVRINGNYVFNQSISAASANFEDTFAADNLSEASVQTNSNNIDVNYYYNQPSPGSLGWLDYFEVQSRNFLTLNKPQILLRDRKSVGLGNITQFNLSAGSGTQVWDVTRPYQPIILPVSYASNVVSFTSPTDSIKEFMAFDGSSYLTPVPDAKIANQNIHGLPFADLFIVTNDLFLSESNKLADLRKSQGLSVNVVTLSQVYNEFSSGVQDLSAVRDMMRMFYKRASTTQEMPKYLLLMGRASYDYKTRITNNTNLIPTYESYESFVPTSSYCSDDYYGLLDDAEGNMFAFEMLDIAIGRIPATDNDNAGIMVDKIIQYSTNQDFGDWKNRLTFVADDEDGNIHEQMANGLADDARTFFKNYNVQKIYIDAFKEVTTAGGARNPDAQAEIVRSVERGCMIINYNGHGGEVGWAAERILNTDDIQNWTNGKKLPLFFTATCEFSRYDDPSRFSAGEYVLLNPNGGGIGLCTTVRLVDAGNNLSLNTSFYKYSGFDSLSFGSRMRVGEIMRNTKNDVLSSNSRNFTLLGDPSLMLAYPDHRVYTTGINNVPISQSTDTLKAYSKVTITGVVKDVNNNLLSNYNGVVYPTVFDKDVTYITLANNPDNSSPMPFQMQNNVIYRGSATVKNGLFVFSFIVPKDIGYQIGNGKISYYASNGIKDAQGYDNRILVGGTADSAGVDVNGPELKLYMNDEKFVFGGLTDENPLFIAKLKDVTGINITGVGLGRELGLTLNNDNTTTQAMNDYYRAKIDSYQEGEVRYPLKGVKLGKNSLKFTAWDVYNNYSESVLDFVVAGSADMALQHVLNYPNPFTTNTTFHFDHNKPGQNIKVLIQIFTVSGKLIKSLQTETTATGSHFDQINWDGKDEYGDPIGKGVYVYKVKVKSDAGKSAEEFQKLVILN